MYNWAIGAMFNILGLHSQINGHTYPYLPDIPYLPCDPSWMQETILLVEANFMLESTQYWCAQQFVLCPCQLSDVQDFKSTNFSLPLDNQRHWIQNCTQWHLTSPAQPAHPDNLLIHFLNIVHLFWWHTGFPCVHGLLYCDQHHWQPFGSLNQP